MDINSLTPLRKVCLLMRCFHETLAYYKLLWTRLYPNLTIQTSIWTHFARALKQYVTFVTHTVTKLNYRGADKSLARPGRKQNTATKL